MIPNGILANNSLTNVTSQDKRQLDIKIGISYQADLKLAKGLIAGILEAEDGILKDRKKESLGTHIKIERQQRTDAAADGQTESCKGPG